MDEMQQPPALLAVRIRFRLFLTAGKRPATMRKNLPRGRLVVALDAPHSASITPRSAEPKPARIVHICPRAVSAAAVGVRIAAQGQGGIEDYEGLREGIARKSAGLGPGGRPKSGITEGFADGSWVLGGAGGADRLQAELRAASRYGTGAAPQPSRALALPAKISPRVSDDGAQRGMWVKRLQNR